MIRINRRQSGVTIVEVLVAVALLAVIGGALLFGFQQLSSQTRNQVGSGDALELFDSIRLVVGTRELCTDALRKSDGTAVTFSLSGNDIVGADLNRLVRDDVEIARVDPTATTGRVRVNSMALRSYGAPPLPEPGTTGRVRLAAYIEAEVQTLPGTRTYTRRIPTQIVAEPDGGAFRAVTCFVQDFRFESITGRIRPSTSASPASAVLEVANVAGPDFFDVVSEDGIPAGDILRINSAAASDLTLGCRSEFGWQLVSCGRVNPATATRSVLVDIVTNPFIHCVSEGLLTGATLQIVCMRVVP